MSLTDSLRRWACGFNFKSGMALTILLGVGLACKRENDNPPPVTEQAAAPTEPPAPLVTPAQSDCERMRAEWQVRSKALADRSPPQRMAGLKKIAASIGEDPEGCVSDQIDSALNDELKKSVWLRINGQAHPAAALFSCSELRDETKCPGRVADDTAHLSERPDLSPIPLTGKERLSIGWEPYTPPATFNAYIAQERALLDGANATPLAVTADGYIASPPIAGGTVLFIITRDSDSQMYRKFVWLLHTKR